MFKYKHLFVFITSILFIYLPNKSFAYNIDCTDNEKTIANQIKKLDCEIRNIAQHINEGKEVIPKTIYHFGQEKYMKENVANRTISKQAWDDFIMGSKTRYALEENRRGFYGTGGIDTNGFGGTPYNWLVEVHIKDECRDPSKVVTFYNLPKSQRFIKWFESLDEKQNPFSSLDEFSNKCFFGSEPAGSYQGDFGSDKRCAKMVNEYTQKTDVKIVQDHVIKKAFYIRDRSCIETIKGTPKELIEFAAKNEFLWLTPCNGYGGGAGSFSLIVIDALTKVEKNVPKNVIEKLIQNFKLASKPTSQLEAYLRCLEKDRVSEFKEFSSKKLNLNTACSN